MFNWVEENLKPKENFLNFDYVFFSYYDEDCPDPHLSKYTGDKWARIFDGLVSDFSPALEFSPHVGFGEIGPQCNCRER